jgi:hypothetical protein
VILDDELCSFASVPEERASIPHGVYCNGDSVWYQHLSVCCVLPDENFAQRSSRVGAKVAPDIEISMGNRGRMAGKVYET